MIGQDIFDRNLVPADTDYRIYRDYLNVSGLDFAFIRNGFTYHTPDDNIQHVESGQIQHMGDNILAVTESILQKDLSDVADRQGGVYFDFFGLRMVVVSKSTLFIAWNTILAGAITLVIYKNLGVIRGLLRLLTLLLLCLFSAAFLPLLVTTTRSALFWYSVFPLVLVLYALPVCFTAFLITPFLDMLFHPRAPPSLLLRQHLLSSCFLSILCSAMMAFYRIGASFLPFCVALSSGTTLFFLSMAASIGWKMEESGLGILLLLTINCLLPFASSDTSLFPWMPWRDHLLARCRTLRHSSSNSLVDCWRTCTVSPPCSLFPLSSVFFHEGNDGPFFPSSSILSVSSELLFF